MKPLKAAAPAPSLVQPFTLRHVPDPRPLRPVRPPTPQPPTLLLLVPLKTTPLCLDVSCNPAPPPNFSLSLSLCHFSSFSLVHACSFVRLLAALREPKKPTVRGLHVVAALCKKPGYVSPIDPSCSVRCFSPETKRPPRYSSFRVDARPLGPRTAGAMEFL